MVSWGFILFACSLLIAHSSARVIEKCNKGPVVWCKNLTTAVDCNAYDNCNETIWSTQKFKLGMTCGSCDIIIENVRDYLDANVTNVTVLRALQYSICKSNILTKELKKECDDLIQNYIDNYLSYLLRLLKSNRPICRILGFCKFFIPPGIVSIADEDSLVYYNDNVVLHFLVRVLKGQDKSLLLGLERYMRGPSYWCHNITSSAECKTTSYCISKVWTVKTYAEDYSDACQICKDTVKHARDQFQSNVTQTKLREILEGSCKLIYTKEITKKYHKLPDEFVSEVAEMLVSKMNPNAICAVSGQCNSPRINHSSTSKSPKQEDGRMNDNVHYKAAFNGNDQFSKQNISSNNTVASTVADSRKGLDKLFNVNMSKEDAIELARTTILCGQLPVVPDLCMKTASASARSLLASFISKGFRKLLGGLKKFFNSRWFFK